MKVPMRGVFILFKQPAAPLPPEGGTANAPLNNVVQHRKSLKL